MKTYKQNEINKLAEILKKDGIISVPTDTVYGLCASINSKIAYEKLIATKKRPTSKPFPIMCANIEQIKKIAEVNKIAEKIINKFMPGPITIVLKKQPELQEYITNGKKTIAVRMATSKALEELIEKTESPVYMSSANISGEPTCKSIDEIKKVFPKIDGILEGTISYGKGSTIIDCTVEPIKLLREGPISLKEIKQVIQIND